MEIQKDIIKDSLKSSGTPASSGLGKRTEKLITALHMVTDFMSQDEPARSRLRILGIRLVSDIHASRADIGQKSTATVSEIMSLISISTSVGLISDMNGNILAREFMSLKSYIDEGHNGDNIIGQFLADQELSALGRPLENSQILSRTSEHPTEKNRNVFYKPKEKVSSNSNRRESVLKLIKDKGEVTIKDISSVILDCSEKTIQRELFALLNDKIIEKSGAKRWSRYFLKREA